MTHVALLGQPSDSNCDPIIEVCDADEGTAVEEGPEIYDDKTKPYGGTHYGDAWGAYTSIMLAYFYMVYVWQVSGKDTSLGPY